MNAPEPLQSARAKLSLRIGSIRQSRFVADRLSLGLIIGALILNILALATLATHVRPTDVMVPTHYSSLRNFDALGPWYFPFEVAAFGLAVTLANTAFAYSSYNRSRLASFLLLSGAIVVGVFTLIVANAFGAVAPQ
ncbi:hypothetical protein HJC99_02080 [Candidatus Saccharibacteria bacterium]|nr:hypothetical protein [Candidatus Saccharibacteria bacterium]